MAVRLGAVLRAVRATFRPVLRTARATFRPFLPAARATFRPVLRAPRAVLRPVLRAVLAVLRAVLRTTRPPVHRLPSLKTQYSVSPERSKPRTVTTAISRCEFIRKLSNKFNNRVNLLTTDQKAGGSSPSGCAVDTQRLKTQEIDEQT